MEREVGELVLNKLSPSVSYVDFCAFIQLYFSIFFSWQDVFMLKELEMKFID